MSLGIAKCYHIQIVMDNFTFGTNTHAEKRRTERTATRGVVTSEGLNHLPDGLLQTAIEALR